MYIEDYGQRRTPSAQEAADLARKVQCPYVPSAEQYRAHLVAAGFGEVHMDDVTADWTGFTQSRAAAYRSARARHASLHGEALVDGLADFYDTVAALFAGGVITGLKIRAG